MKFIVWLYLYFIITSAASATIFNTSEVVKLSDNCSIWEIHDSESGQCKCGPTYNGFIECGEYGVISKPNRGLCLTLMDNTTAVVSPCVYSYRYLLQTLVKEKESKDIFTLQDTCSNFHRQGLLCGQCEDGYGVPAYSTYIGCIPCSDNKINWFKYLAGVLVPLTVFFLIVIVFQSSVTLGAMMPCVIISQILSTQQLQRTYKQIYITRYSHYESIMFSLYYLWNLDIFRNLYSPFCISHSLSPLHIISLDYLVAVYPLVVIAIFYSLLSLHDRFGLVRYLYSPVNFLLHKVRKDWNIDSSLAKSSATLLLLSYSKVLSVSFQLLSPVHYFFKNGSQSQAYVHYHPTLPYLSGKHYPYFILAVSMITVFNVLPILLMCFYPCSCFQKLLDVTRLRSQTINVFMDAFHGSYKHKPIYLRYFTAFFLLLEVVNEVVLSTFYFNDYTQFMSYVLLAFSMLVVICRPYKNHHHNITCTSLFIVATLWYISLNYVMQQSYLASQEWRNCVYCFSKVLSFIPPLYGLAVLLYMILPTKLKEVLHTGWRKMCRRTSDYDEMTESLPHRLISNN